MQNDLFLKALQCKNDSGRPPIWIMRQAGRYMPQYRKIREKHSFLEMCHTPEIATEITLQPIREFNMDAAILFSDILVIPEALGVGLQFIESRGPVIERPIRTKQDVEQLPNADVRTKLHYVSEAIRLLKPELKVPLIGFCGAPFTVASYMIEGESSRDLKRTKQWMLRDPNGFHSLLQRLADDSIEYLNMQIDAGVDAIQIFDSWANFLGANQFREFSLEYLNKILRGIKKTPTILFCRGSSVFAKDLASILPSGISLDWNADLQRVRKEVPTGVALQGNLDPDILYGSKNVIEREVNRLLSDMKDDPGYIFNLGHGIKPDMSVESVRTLVECVQNYSCVQV